MTSTPPPTDPRALVVLRRYSAGEVSAYDAACDVQDLGLAGYDDPSAGDVVHWVRVLGFGIPTPSEAEARAEADEILRRLEGGAPQGRAGDATSQDGDGLPRR